MRIDPAEAAATEDMMFRTQESSQKPSDDFASAFEALLRENDETAPKTGESDEPLEIPIELRNDRPREATGNAPFALDDLLPFQNRTPQPNGATDSGLLPLETVDVAAYPIVGPEQPAPNTVALRNTAPTQSLNTDSVPNSTDSIATVEPVTAGTVESMLGKNIETAPPRVDSQETNTVLRFDSMPGATRTITSDSKIGKPGPEPIAMPAPPTADPDESITTQTLAAASTLAPRSDSTGPRSDAARSRVSDARLDTLALRDSNRDDAPTRLDSRAETDSQFSEGKARPTIAPPVRITATETPIQSGVTAPATEMRSPAASFAPGITTDAVGSSVPSGESSSLPSEPVQALAQRVQIMAAQGGGTARMRLSPPELGDLQIRVSLRGSVVEVAIQAHEPAAQLAVMSQREHLAEALGVRDLRMESFDVFGGDQTAPEHDLLGQESPGQPTFGDETGEQTDARELARDGAVRFDPRDTQRVTTASTTTPGSGVDLRI